MGRLHEHNATAQPRHCNGRVVGPKPKHEAKDRKGGDGPNIDISRDSIKVENEDGDGDGIRVNEDGIHVPDHDKRRITFPLKDIMRHEAGKRAEAAKQEPFCNLVRGQWPEAACDEGMSQHNARLFYKDNCGQKSKTMLPGIDCPKLRKEIKKIYPDVDKEPKNTATALEKQQRHQEAIELLSPFYGEKGASDVLEGLLTDRELNTTVHSSRRSRQRLCILPVCKAQPRADCSELEDAYEKASKHVGLDIDWTSSDDECGISDWKRSQTQTKPEVTATARAERKIVRKLCINKAYQKLGGLWGGENEVYDHMNTLFDDVHWTSDDEYCKNYAPPKYRLGRKEKMCVREYCHPSVVDADCSDVEDKLEELSKYAGQNVDWTSDDDECGNWKRSHNQTLV